MKKLLFILLFISALANAQETEFTFNNERGMTDFVVTNVEGKTAPEIYKKAIEWIKITYLRMKINYLKTKNAYLSQKLNERKY